ncbi:helix-turn-helix domain-containing protein [Natronospora cellulosivora (SeqCode)]
MKDLNEILLNPVRIRIIQYLAVNQKATPGDIVSFMTDVSRTTLYRHLKVLAKNEIITVVEENRVRGSVERTYALNLKTLSEHNTVENATTNAFGFLMKIYADIENYFKDKNADPEADTVFLNNVTLLLSDEEFHQLLEDINILLRKHLDNKADKKRKIRSLSFISCPPIQDMDEDHE